MTVIVGASNTDVTNNATRKLVTDGLEIAGRMGRAALMLLLVSGGGPGVVVH